MVVLFLVKSSSCGTVVVGRCVWLIIDDTCVALLMDTVFGIPSSSMVTAFFYTLKMNNVAVVLD